MASLRFLVTFKLKIRDQNHYNSALMVFVREYITSKMLSSEAPPMENGIYIELNLCKWLVCCTYNDNKNNISNYLNVLRRSLGSYSVSYENLIITGDLIKETNQQCTKLFFETYSLTNLIKERTCFKNPKNPSYKDVILTDNPQIFQSLCVVETGLYDFRKMTMIVVKATFRRLKLNVTHHRNY